MEEIWNNIEGYDGKYQVSNLGRVRNTQKNIIMTDRKRGKGYMAVTLTDYTGKHKDYYIHRLVANAFIPNPDKLSQVNHKDEDKTNNCAYNLEWCDCKYNINYGTRSTRSCSNRKYSKRKGTTIYQYTLDKEFVRSWESLNEIYNTLGIFRSCISKCCRGVYNQSHGFLWSCKELGGLTSSPQ